MLGFFYFSWLINRRVNLVVFWYFDSIKSSYEYKHDKDLAEAKLEFQKSHYELLEKHQYEIEALWHDMEKHISFLEALYESNLKYEAKDYINILRNKIDSIPTIIRTPVPVINVILTNALSMAENENIEVLLDLNITHDFNINTFDLCIILGNIIENAIDACQVLQESEKRFIDLKILQEGKILLIDIKNPFSSDNTSVRQRNRKHGYGLDNVHKVVKKYGGNIEIDSHDNIFHVSIILS